MKKSMSIPAFVLMAALFSIVGHAGTSSSKDNAPAAPGEITLSAEESVDWSFGGLLPFNGPERRAGLKAKQKLVEECKTRYGGKIRGPISLTTVRDDEGCVCADVRATAICVAGEHAAPQVEPQDDAPGAGSETAM